MKGLFQTGHRFISQLSRLSRMQLSACGCLFLTFFFANPIEAATIHVPQDVPSIQQAINSAANGDTVLVAPGTYPENINFTGKAITVISEQGSEVTIIDGRSLGSVVSFISGEGRPAILDGFTLRNGKSSLRGGGIRIESSSPTIRNNVIRRNGACAGGNGISILFGSPLIQDNLIAENFAVNCTGGTGGGIVILFNSAAEILGNTISDNVMEGGSGGGIALFAAGSPKIQGNFITRNTAQGLSPCAQGGGIWLVNFNQASIVQNVITGNTAGCGGGVYWSGSGSGGFSSFINNTIVDNAAATGPEVFTSAVDNRGHMINNIISSKPGLTAVFCELFGPPVQPDFQFNNVFSFGGNEYGGVCTNQTGLNGNISANPSFVDANAGDFRLAFGSASIDVGNNAIAGIPATDFDGNTRIADGDNDGVATIDMGALEFTDVVANAGDDQVVSVNENCLATVFLDGRGSFDAGGEQLNFVWTGSFGTASGATPSISLPKGQHIITLTVSDPHGNTASDTVVVTVVDSTLPTIAGATATPNVLLQANHQMVPVTVGLSVSDNCDPSVVCRIVSVTSNEPVEGLGDGDTSPDWKITGNLTVNVRAERSAHGNGRVYTITVECQDSSGNVSTRTVPVNVPRNN